MKKSIIALAVAGAMTAPIIAQADATLYGRINERVVFQEDKDMEVKNAGHRFGVKGSSETDSGLTAFYQMEFQVGNDTESARTSASSTVDANLKVRQANAGLKGDFGKMTIGRFTNPLVSTYTGDIFEGESGPYQLAPYRVGSAVSYATPSMGGFDASLTVIGEGEGSDAVNEDIDGYIAVVNGSFGPVGVSLAYQDADYGTAAPMEAEIASLGLSYSANGLYVGLGYEEDDVSDSQVIDFGAKYTMGKLGLGLGWAEKEVGSVKTDRTVLGAYYDLGGSADVYTEFAAYDGDSASDEFNRLSIGYRVKF